MRRAGPLALLSLALLAPLALSAVAQQPAAWIASLRWPDGKEVQWRATTSPGCDGSNVDLMLKNNSSSSGTAKVNSVTFACKRAGEFTSPGRVMGSVAPGGEAIAPTINCACADKGGVKDVLAVDLEFLRDGAGQETVANGCSYSGNYANGQRSGKGVYTCAGGYRYEGNFMLGEQNGIGAETLPSGQKYEGNFVNGKRQGLGKMNYTDGSYYEGEFRDSKREGVGTSTYKDKSQYIGEWKGDLRVGHGAYVSADKAWTFDGEWVNNFRNGPGKLSYADGSYTYEGPFKNDLREGQGTATFGDGRVFRGVFVANEQVGPGTLTFPDGRKVVGDFKDHRPNGQAIETGPVATFDGTWANGVLEGKAVVTYATGERFEGVFTAGKRNGLGIDTRTDGSKEECRWVNDVRQEPCNKITKDGKRIEFRSTKGKTRN
jgi:hypothetical protein